MTITDHHRLAHFVERFALSLTHEGFPRMSARAFAAILVSREGGLTAAEIGDVLGVSAAAISGATRHLTAVGLVERHREPGSRRDTYRLLDDVWYESFSRADDRFARWATDLAIAMEATDPSSAAHRRLQDAQHFFTFLRESFPGLMAAWRSRRQAADDLPGAATGPRLLPRPRGEEGAPGTGPPSPG